jgi:hypothetical protein
MVTITITHHLEGKFRVWAATGVNERNGIPFVTLDEANDHAKQLQAKAGGPDNAEIVVNPTRIAISQAAFDAIISNLPLGSFGFEAEAKGERQIWLNPAVIDRLRATLGPGDSYSDVILRLVEAGRLKQTFTNR